MLASLEGFHFSFTHTIINNKIISKITMSNDILKQDLLAMMLNLFSFNVRKTTHVVQTMPYPIKRFLL